MPLSEAMNILICCLTILLFLVCWSLLIAKRIKSKFSPVKSVQATVVDKYKTQTASKIYGTFNREQCIVVFSVEQKKLAFAVSEFSFTNYQINEKGTLKYQGNQLIDFS